MAAMMSAINILEQQDESKTRGEFTAVDKVNLAISEGSIYGFPDQIGDGKSTTIRMILDIIKPGSGSVPILGSPSVLQYLNRIG